MEPTLRHQFNIETIISNENKNPVSPGIILLYNSDMERTLAVSSEVDYKPEWKHPTGVDETLNELAVLETEEIPFANEN